MRRIMFLSLFFFLVSAVEAQEFFFLAGATRDRTSRRSSYGWMLDYRQPLSERYAVSLAWLNEGHVPGHHRDGQSVQLWRTVALPRQRLTLAVGVGPYRYFDTTVAAQGGSFSDDHGWGVITSLSATWQSAGRWNLHMRANHIETATDLDTTSILFGLGFRLDAKDSPGAASLEPDDRRYDSEITLLVGRSVVNSFASEHGVAAGLEYRRAFTPHAEWTVTWLDEGDARLIRRNGIATQLWLTGEFEDRRVGLGAGIGPYWLVDKHRRTQAGHDGDEAVAVLVSMTASYRFHPRWRARLLWNRIATDYSRDTDVFLVGLGYSY